MAVFCGRTVFSWYGCFLQKSGDEYLYDVWILVFDKIRLCYAIKWFCFCVNSHILCGFKKNHQMNQQILVPIGMLVFIDGENKGVL